MPGETAYVLLQPDRPAPPAARAAAVGGPDAPWYSPALGQRAGGRPARSAPSAVTAPDPRDARAVGLQLGRTPRAMTGVAHRCPCALPDVVETKPRLDDGTPFPTLYYLTCPRLASAIGTLEADGLMKEQTARLAEDPELQRPVRGGGARTTSPAATASRCSRACPRRAACRPG